MSEAGSNGELLMLMRYLPDSYRDRLSLVSSLCQYDRALSDDRSKNFLEGFVILQGMQTGNKQIIKNIEFKMN